MPIRVQPKRDFGLCSLNLDSIKAITERVEREFKGTKYSAIDGFWEVYDEPQATFLDAISKHKTLDAFKVFASDPANGRAKAELVFSEVEASLVFQGDPTNLDWLEHFTIDIKKHVLSSSFRQRFRGPQKMFITSTLGDIKALSSMNIESLEFGEPYCRIVLYKAPPDPFIQSIWANLVSNFIWIFLGGVLTLIGAALAPSILNFIQGLLNTK